MHEKSFPMGQQNRMGDLKLAGKPDVVTAGFPPQGKVGRAAIAALMRALLAENAPKAREGNNGTGNAAKGITPKDGVGGRRIDLGGGITIRDEGGGAVTDADRAALALARELMVPGPGDLGADAPRPLRLLWPMFPPEPDRRARKAQVTKTDTDPRPLLNAAGLWAEQAGQQYYLGSVHGV